MGFSLYLVISILVGYITYKFQEENLKEQLTKQYNSWLDCQAFWIIVAFGLLWFIAIPVWIVFWVLEKTIGKIIEQIKNKEK